jgi:hypothetical protein
MRTSAIAQQYAHLRALGDDVLGRVLARTISSLLPRSTTLRLPGEPAGGCVVPPGGNLTGRIGARQSIPPTQSAALTDLPVWSRTGAAP